MAETGLTPDVSRRISSFGLTGGPDDTEPVSIGASDWSAVVGKVRRHKLTGLAVAAMDAGWLRLSAEHAQYLRELQRERMMQALDLERRLLRIADGLGSAGIDCAALKGPAFAHRFYPQPSWRPFGDLDLMVRTSEWRDACKVLTELGYLRQRPEPRAGFDVRFGKAAVHKHDDGAEVDLHRTLVLGPFGLWLDPDELFARSAWFELGGRKVRCLDDTACFVNACLHAALGWSPPLWMPVRDVAQILEVGEIDWELFDRWVEEWRLPVVIRTALNLTEEVLSWNMPSKARAYADDLRISRSDERIVESYTTGRRERGGMALATFRALPELSSKLAYGWHLLVPSREFVDARHDRTGSRSYLARWATLPGWWLARMRQRS